MSLPPSPSRPLARIAARRVVLLPGQYTTVKVEPGVQRPVTELLPVGVRGEDVKFFWLATKKFQLTLNGLSFTAQTPNGKVQVTSSLVGRTWSAAVPAGPDAFSDRSPCLWQGPSGPVPGKFLPDVTENF